MGYNQQRRGYSNLTTWLKRLIESNDPDQSATAEEQVDFFGARQRDIFTTREAQTPTQVQTWTSQQIIIETDDDDTSFSSLPPLEPGTPSNSKQAAQDLEEWEP